MVDPGYLYKYRSLEGWKTRKFTKSIITNNELFFAHPDSFNDPFELGFSISLDAPEGEVRDWLIETEMKRHPGSTHDEAKKYADKNIGEFIGPNKEKLKPKLEEQIPQRFRNRVGVLSLSQKKDDILMWSHYANCHRGLCFEFLDTNNTSFFSQAKPVNYQVEYPVINPFFDTDEEKGRKILLTKSSQWCYEKEWRVIDYKNKWGVQNFTEELLTGVIFGCEISNKDKNKVLKWLSNRSQVKVYEARRNSSNYILEIIPL